MPLVAHMDVCGRTATLGMLSELYSDQRNHDYQGPSRSVRCARACTVGGGTFAISQDGSRCVVAGKDVLRILRVTDPPRSRSLPSRKPVHVQRPNSVDIRLNTGHGGATIEASQNMWTASGLKIDSAPTDVVWARGNFDNKILTSARNGEIIYWDINKYGSKYETRIKEHNRAVNKLAISPFLPYLIASGSQDGYLRIWDLRTPPSSSMKVYHPTGIRALSLSPVPSSPLTVCTGLESGNVQRWDLRNKATPLERITLAHSSSLLSMDWQLPSMKETGLGWLVTSGMDRRVKIWDLCLPAGASVPVNANDRDAVLLNKKMGPRAFRTLHTPYAVRNVCWRPGYDCEVAVVSNNESDSESVEIWDIRRCWIGKWALEGTEGGITDIAFIGSHALWAQHANGSFAQHDLRESFRPLDSIPRVAMSWTACDNLAFVANSTPVVEVPFDDFEPHKTALLQELRLRPKATGDPMYIPLEQTLGVQNVPLFDTAAFSQLAKSYIFEGDRGRVCATNAETASLAGQFRAAQTWELLHSQLIDLRGTPPPSVSSLRLPSHAEPQTRLSSASASIISRNALERSGRPKASQATLTPNTHIDTRPVSPSFHRTRDHSKHGQSTPPSSGSSSPRPTTTTVPSRSRQLSSRSWLESSPISQYDASPSSVKSSSSSRRASTVLPVPPRLPRPAFRRASFSSPIDPNGSPISDNSKDHKHVHVGEGALDDSDSSSGSGSSESGASSCPNVPEQSTQDASVSSVARLVRGTKVLPSPLSKLVLSRDDSPDGHLASDERSMGEYDSDASDASDASHSPPSTSSPSSESQLTSSPYKFPSPSKDERPRHHQSPGRSLNRNRDTSLNISHRSLSKQESQSSIRTVTAPPCDPASARPPSLDRMSMEVEQRAHHGNRVPVGPSSEGMSTRRPSPQRHRPPMIPGLGLGLSHMDDDNNVKMNGHAQHTWTLDGRLSESRISEIQVDEARLRDIGWKALQDSIDWFAEKGDVQMCTMLALVAPEELQISTARAIRFVEAYIDILSRLQLHTLAAHLRKYVPHDAVRAASEVQTTVYSSCGRCRSPVKLSVPGGPILCTKCKSLPTLCAICHLPVRKLLVHCPTCGHGGHQACYRAFYLSRPLTMLPTHAGAGIIHGPGDSYSSTDTSSTAYYSLSDGERDARGDDDVQDDDESEPDGRGSDREKGKEELYEYEPSMTTVSERRSKMRVLGHACAAGCGHWCWAANDRFS